MIRMVIIDDEYFFRRAIMDMPWDAQGIEIVGDANDGQSGLNLILEQQPDIAIVDINMPIYSGLTLIRMAREAGVQCRYIILTGYDEFRYAREAISLECSGYLMKPVNWTELMESIVKEAQSIRRSQDQERLVHGLTQEYQQSRLAREFSELITLPGTGKHITSQLQILLENYGYFGIGVIHIANSRSLEYQAALRRQFSELDMGTPCLILLDQQGRLVVFAKVDTPDALQNLLQRLIAYAETEENRFVLGIGGICDNFSQLIPAYRRACADLHRRLYEDHSHPLNTGFLLQLARYKGKLEAAAKAHDMDKAEMLLRSAYNALSAQSPGYDLLLLTSMDFVNVLLQVMVHQGLSVDAPFGSSATLVTQLEFCQTTQDFLDWLTSLYRDGILRMKTQNAHFSEVTLKVINYINNHLADSALSIKTISDDLYLNYSHICNTFKRDVGMTINDFIISERMKRAKVLIDGGASSIALVSEQVGYNDQSYFSKSFRKYFGASPVNYIQQSRVCTDSTDPK